MQIWVYVRRLIVEVRVELAFRRFAIAGLRACGRAIPK